MSEIKNKDLLYPELSYEVVGAVFEVWKNFGSIHKESVYQKSLEIEFQKRKIPFNSQPRIPITYSDKKVGVYVPDFVIDKKVIIEIKRLPLITLKERKQIWYYLKGTSYKLLLLVNFGTHKPEVIRWVYDRARRK
jgi:GxxExxY protein